MSNFETTISEQENQIEVLQNALKQRDEMIQMSGEVKLDLETQAKETRTELEQSKEELTSQLQECRALIGRLKADCAVKTERNLSLE